MARIYYSVDIETNGLAAGLHSMISLGVAAIDMETGEITSTFKRNLEVLPDLAVCPLTMEWWKGFPEAYQRARENASFPYKVMYELEGWVLATKSEDHPVVAAWKPSFDIGFLQYYLHRFLGRSIFGRAGSGLDIKTLAAIALNQKFSETKINKTVERLYPNMPPHSHDALEDAVEQAHVMYKAVKILGVNL
jgi:DNA polymerase III alpha subunit (gram-positive type)